MGAFYIFTNVIVRSSLKTNIDISFLRTDKFMIIFYMTEKTFM